jgi:mannitol/fructose-specific phosphotransferase system IIA component (Ntr-type)
MRFVDLLHPERLLVQGQATVAEEAIRQLVGRLQATGALADAAAVLALVLEREEQYPTGIGAGVALPHCCCAPIAEPVIAVGHYPQGLDFGAPDGPATLVVLLLSPSDHSSGHLKLLARISRLARQGLAQRAQNAASAGQLIATVAAVERDFLDL